MSTDSSRKSKEVIDNGDYRATGEEEIAAIEYELRQIDVELQKLSDRRKILTQRKEKLRDDALIKKSLSLSGRKWDTEDFPWSGRLRDALRNVFRIKEFRQLQLSTINSVLSGEDVILIMPTGGGKSLCYQLPAVISKGITMVVSPLVSLMEDQLHGLRKVNVTAMMLNSNASKEDVKETMNAMTDPGSKLHLIYITPEYLAKSKRFLSKLQKAYTMKRLDMIAIDEVHCCSQWGHDFRPDYKFLGVMKSMFPDVAILGLTATAPVKIIADVQKMLEIQGCLVLRASFNRPNLFYEVRDKPADKSECVALLEDLLKNRFAGKTGIIYTTTIKESEELMTDLRSRGLRVGCYHASLEADFRSKVHAKWLSGEYQAVVATIAFGLGIDKPDVRFVIHHCISKSMENFYQESGRAGRDGEKADCIVLYRLADVFKLSCMVFKDKVGLENLYRVISFCLEHTTCRRSLIATHFEEVWTASDCAKMCDNCRQPRWKKEIDISPYCKHLYEIMTKAVQSDTRLTALKLIDSWFGKGQVTLRVSSVPTSKFPRETAEAVVGHLLVEGYLQEEFHFTAYSTISYLKRGPKAALALGTNQEIPFNVKGTPRKEIKTDTKEAKKNDAKSSGSDGKSKQSSASSKSTSGSSKSESKSRKDDKKASKSEQDRRQGSKREHRDNSKDSIASKKNEISRTNETRPDRKPEATAGGSQENAKRKIIVIESSDEEDNEKRKKVG